MLVQETVFKSYMEKEFSSKKKELSNAVEVAMGCVRRQRGPPPPSVCLFAFLVLAFPKDVEIRGGMLVFGDRILTLGGTGDS